MPILHVIPSVTLISIREEHKIHAVLFVRGRGMASLVTLTLFSYLGGVQFEFLLGTDYSDVLIIFVSLLPPTHPHLPFRLILSLLYILLLALCLFCISEGMKSHKSLLSSCNHFFPTSCQVIFSPCLLVLSHPVDLLPLIFNSNALLSNLGLSYVFILSNHHNCLFY